MKLKILGIKPAVSKADKIYWKVQTDRGNMTAFDKELVEELGHSIEYEQEVNLNVAQSEKDGITYQNIRGFDMNNEDYAKETAMTMEKPYVKPQEFGKAPLGRQDPASENKFTTMYVSYAKDLFIALGGDSSIAGKSPSLTMDLAINLVKQAQKAFS